MNTRYACHQRRLEQGPRLLSCPPSRIWKCVRLKSNCLGLQSECLANTNGCAQSSPRSGNASHPTAECGKATFLWYRSALDDGQRLKGKWQLGHPLPNVASRRNNLTAGMRTRAQGRECWLGLNPCQGYLDHACTFPLVKRCSARQLHFPNMVYVMLRPKSVGGTGL
jgi:hypothetical protein